MTNNADDDGAGSLNLRWPKTVNPNDQTVEAAVFPEKGRF